MRSATMQPLGEDVSEQLARVAAAFKVIRTIRRKTVCPCCHHIWQPPMPGLPITRSIAHPSLLADILVSKYADHQPLYRQSVIAARDGVKLDPASMGRWVGQCEALCEPLTEALRRYTMADVQAACGRHADPGARTGQQEDQDRAAVGLRARRQSFGLDGTGCGMVCLLARPQRHPSSDPSRRIRGHPAGGRLRRLCCVQIYVAAPDPRRGNGGIPRLLT